MPYCTAKINSGKFTWSRIYSNMLNHLNRQAHTLSSMLLSNSWLYWVDLRIFDETQNPNGNVLSGNVYTAILIVMIVIGITVMIKRLLISLLLGKKKYSTYGPMMEKIMRKVLLIAEVSLLGEDIEFSAKNLQKEAMAKLSKSPARGWLFTNYGDVVDAAGDEDVEDEDISLTDASHPRKYSDLYDIAGMEGNDEDNTAPPQEVEETIARENTRKGLKWKPFQKSGTSKEVKKFLQQPTKDLELQTLLGEWEEPETLNKVAWEDNISIRKILQFRESLKYMDGSHPLSVPFGRADTRKSCTVSAQRIYERLLLKTPGAKELHFDTIMVLAMDQDGKLQKDKARALIRLFRPDRQGNISLIDFVRSCDRMYRRVRMFRATTLKSAQLDDAFERLVNFGFYFLLFFAVIVAIGLDATNIVAVSASVLLPLSFLFSASASKYVEVSLDSKQGTPIPFLFFISELIHFVIHFLISF